MDENDDTLLFVRKTSRPLLLTSTVLLQSSSTCYFWDWRSRRPGLIPPQVCIRLSIYEYHTLGSSAQILKWRRPSTYIFFLWFFSKYNNSIDLISHLTSHWHPKSSSLVVEGEQELFHMDTIWFEPRSFCGPDFQAPKRSDTSESSSLALRPSTFWPPKQRPRANKHMQLQL